MSAGLKKTAIIIFFVVKKLNIAQAKIQTFASEKIFI